MEAMLPSPRVELLLEDSTNSLATITARQREDRNEDIDVFPQIIDEPAMRSQCRMEWEERGKFSSKGQW